MNGLGNLGIPDPFFLLDLIGFVQEAHVATLLSVLVFEYPDRESNSELSFRRALLYPFNYQGKVLFGCKGKAFFAESQTNIQ